jgi:hypothetical protein
MMRMEMHEFIQKFEKALRTLTYTIAYGTAKSAELYWQHNIKNYTDAKHKSPAHTFGDYFNSLVVNVKNKELDRVWVQVTNQAPYASVLEDGGNVSVTLEEIEMWAEQKRALYGQEFNVKAVWEKIKNEGIYAWKLGEQSADDTVKGLDGVINFLLDKVFEVGV